MKIRRAPKILLLIFVLTSLLPAMANAEAIIGSDQAAGVINLGISGNQVVSDLLGVNAQARLDRDVLSQTGVTHVIVIGASTISACLCC